MAESITHAEFGQSLNGMSKEESGEQLKRLCEVGLHGYRAALGSGRYAIEVKSLTFLGEAFPLYTPNEISAVLAALCHLPIASPRQVNDTPLRQAIRRGQMVLLDGGR